MKLVGKLKTINLIQFVPVIFIVSLVGNSILGYTAPTVKSSANQTKEVKADTEKKSQAVSVGDIDLSKIKDGVYQGTGTGFRGKVKVSVTVKSHKMTEIKVLSNSDDAAYFNRASSGVIKSILAKQSLEVDVVSGATYSSKGIIAAVKNALTGEEDNSAAAGSESSGSSAKKVGTTDESGEYKDGTYTGTGSGFHGIVKVSVTIKSNSIKSIKVLENHDDAAYFNRASGTLIPLMIKKQTTNVDAVSGATYSSNGIIKAVRNALSKATIKKSSKTSDDNNSSKNQSDQKDDSASSGVSGTYKDGIYEGSGQGFRGTVNVQVKIKYSKITKIQILSKSDDEPYFTNALDVLDAIIAKQNTNVDVISGATYSSKGIVKAVENALKKALVNKDENENSDSNNNDNPEQDNSEENNNPEGSSVYIGNAVCDPDEYEDFYAYDLSLEIAVKDGKVTAIQNVKGSGGQNYLPVNDGYIDMAKKVILPKILNADASAYDVVSGATCSSKAIVAAYENAVSKIQK